MRQVSHQLSVPTCGKGLYSINRQVVDWVGQSGMRLGLYVFEHRRSEQRRNVLLRGLIAVISWRPINRTTPK